MNSDKKKRTHARKVEREREMEKNKRLATAAKVYV